MTYYYDDTISRLNQARDETLSEMKQYEESTSEWIELWQIERDLGSILFRLAMIQERERDKVEPEPVTEVIWPDSSPVLGFCTHGYDLNTQFCPLGCRV